MFNLQRTEQDQRQLARWLVLHPQYALVFQNARKTSEGLPHVALELFRCSCSRIALLLLPHKQTLGEEKNTSVTLLEWRQPRGNLCICSDAVGVGSVTASNPHVIRPKHSLGKKKNLIKNASRKVSSSRSVCTFCPSAARYQTRADGCQVCP